MITTASQQLVMLQCAGSAGLGVGREETNGQSMTGDKAQESQAGQGKSQALRQQQVGSSGS